MYNIKNIKLPIDTMPKVIFSRIKKIYIIGTNSNDSNENRLLR